MVVLPEHLLNLCLATNNPSDQVRDHSVTALSQILIPVILSAKRKGKWKQPAEGSTECLIDNCGGIAMLYPILIKMT